MVIFSFSYSLTILYTFLPRGGVEKLAWIDQRLGGFIPDTFERSLLNA